jgi:LytR cell envelope-related transcriptional attenuator
VRIPSGDLAPARRHRHSQSRSRGSRTLPVLLALGLVAAIAGGAYVLRRQDDTAGRTTAAPRCSPVPTATAGATPTATVVPARPVALPAPGTVSLRLLNGTSRNGLGRTVGDQLAKRGFTVLSTGNAPKQLAGASQVTYGRGAEAAAQLVATHIGASVTAAPKAARGSVAVVLGSSFTGLRTPAQAKAAAGHVMAVVPAASAPASASGPAPAPTAAATASGACR